VLYNLNKINIIEVRIMQMNERIKYLRKIYLKMSQEVFGEHLGVSRSVINNIELNTLARPDQKLSLIKLMCREFNVSERWILNGTEPMIIQPEKFSLNQFAKEKRMTKDDLKFVKAYFELEPEVRQTMIDFFRKVIDINIENTFTIEYDECWKQQTIK